MLVSSLFFLDWYIIIVITDTQIQVNLTVKPSIAIMTILICITLDPGKNPDTCIVHDYVIFTENLYLILWYLKYLKWTKYTKIPFSYK